MFGAQPNRPNDVLANERFKREDARSYDLAAETFERLSAVYTAPFADVLVTSARVSSGSLVLDLGAGTGIVARRLTDAGAMCVAADLSEGMLRTAARHAPVLRMDAEAFAIQPRSLDAVVSLFAMMHFPAPETVLHTCFAALKPGGVLTFAFGAPAPWPGAILRVPRALLDQVKTQTGRMLTAPHTLNVRLPPASTEPETPLARRSRNAVKDLLQLTREAGFCQTQKGWIGRRFEIPSAEEFWELQAVFSSKARKALAAMEAPAVERLRTKFLADSQAVLDRGGSLIYPVGAAWIRGTKPFE